MNCTKQEIDRFKQQAQSLPMANSVFRNVCRTISLQPDLTGQKIKYIHMNIKKYYLRSKI
jgi:hypothetical protein